MPAIEPAAFKHRGQQFTFHGMAEDEHILRILRNGVFYDVALLDAIERLRIPGTYLDLGANIGSHASYFLRFCDCSQVVSVESHPDIFQVLMDNVSANNKTGKTHIAHNAAVAGSLKGACAGDINPRNAGQTRVVATGAGVPVATLRLSFLISEFRPGLVKMDLQGWECCSIMEALDDIDAHKPTISVRCPPAEQGDADFATINRSLRGMGYQTFGPWCYSPIHIWIHETNSQQIDAIKECRYDHAERKP